MWKITAAFLYTFITISNALQSNSTSIENGALHSQNPEYVGEEELQYVVSLGVFKDGNYIHICLAVMITGLNGITARQCGHYGYYAERAGLIECEKNLAEKNRTKLHVNTKRPMHSHPDMFYTVIRFIDFHNYLSNENKRANHYEGPNIGSFVLKKEVQYTRPVLNMRMSAIEKLSKDTVLTLIGMSTINNRRSGEKMLIKKRLMRTSILSPVAFPQIRAVRLLSFYYEPLTLEDLGAPVYAGDQYIGILIHHSWCALIAVDAYFEKYINEIIASTWISRINERQIKGRAKASITKSTARSHVNIDN